MAFNIFSQPTGPQVSISLFGDAASQGAKLGAEIPSAVTAGINGAIEGVETGQKIVSNANAITEQNQTIARNDLQNKILQNAQAIDQATYEDRLKVAVATSDEQLKNITTKNTIADTLASNDPQKLTDLLSSPDYHRYILDNPKSADDIVGAIIQHPDIPERTKDIAKGSLDAFKVWQLQINEDKVRALEDAKFAKGIDQAKDSFVRSAPTINSLIPDTIKPSEYSARVKHIPSWQANYNEDGTLNTTLSNPKPNHKPLPEDNFEDLVIDGKFAGKVRPSEVGHFDLYTQSLDAGTRTLRRATGLPADGAPQKPALDTPQVSSIPTLGSAPAPTPSDKQNSAIVDKALEDFRSIPKPPGMHNGTLEDRYQAQKAARQQVLGIDNKPSFRKSSGSVSDFLVPPAEADEKIASSSEILSNYVKAPVELNVEASPALSSKVKDRVNTDPLTRDEPPLMKALISHESAGVRGAKSPVIKDSQGNIISGGVVGLAQVTQRVARSYGLNRDIPKENIQAGKDYLRDLLFKFDGDLRLALTAYSAAGPGVVADAVRETGSTEWGKIKSYLKDNLSSSRYKQAANYADKIISIVPHYMNKRDDVNDAFVYLLQQNNLLKDK